MATIFQINFDFTSSRQRAILEFLQEHGYQLLGFKGARGPGQVTAGIPTWFSKPFSEQFGEVSIEYKPLYKVYAYRSTPIGPNTIIKMESASAEVPLGTHVVFNQNGTFNAEPGGAPDGIITVSHNRPETSSVVTLGLAAEVEGQYRPFCAFMSTPQSTISMEPNEKVCLFAARLNLQSGSVVGNAATPGALFEFNASRLVFNLEMIRGSYGIQSSDSDDAVREVASGKNLLKLLG